MSLHTHVQTWCPLKSEDSIGSLDLELQMVVNHLVGSGSLTPVLCKNKQYFHHWAISVVWFVFFFGVFGVLLLLLHSFLICLFSCVQFVRMNLNFVFRKVQRNLKIIFLTFWKVFFMKRAGLWDVDEVLLYHDESLGFYYSSFFICISALYGSHLRVVCVSP